MPRIRTALVAAGVAVAGAVVPAGAGAAAPAAQSAATGGTVFFQPPIISRVECRTGCTVSSARRRSTARSVSVKERGVVVIRGKRVARTVRVKFLGGVGTSDDRAVAPKAVGRASVTAEVPASAVSGHVALVGADGAESSPSKQIVTVIHPEKATGGTEVGAKPDPGQTREPQDQPGMGSLPWPVIGPVTSPYGPRWGRMHTGIDIGKPSGSSIRAVAAGKVIIASWQGGYGNFTCIAHVTISSCYAHQSRYLVSLGDYVEKGQVIGKVGCTGNCYGDHLHFEIRLGRAPWSTPTNPIPYLRARSRSAVAAGINYGKPMDFSLPVYGPPTPR